MDKVKKIFLISVPLSICNFRCHYCYLAQRAECYQGVQPTMKYTPEEFARAFCQERVGGPAYFNFCADGETLLTKDIDLYLKAVVQQGHYVEVVSNMTVTPMLNKILSWEPELLKHVEFKCSFHYLELKKKNLLDTFARNVNAVWNAGASANIEITPSDELIPYIDEVKEFSMENFGALPHLTIARNDNDDQITRLTKLDLSSYEKVWSQFHSSFWEYKSSIFGKKQTGICYAGKWSLFINMATGQAKQCYCGKSLGDIIADPDSPLPEEPIYRCPLPHCYNGHALMTLGLVPNGTDVRYGDIRNRVREDGREWLQPELKAFFNSTCVESNRELTLPQKAYCESKFLLSYVPRGFRKIRRISQSLLHKGS